MAKRQKKSALQKEYQKARKNAKARYNRALSKGLALDFQFPSVPKRITQGSINRLNKINANYISKHSEQLFDETAVTDEEVINENFNEEIESILELIRYVAGYSDLGGANLVLNWIREMRQAVGDKIFARALQADAKYNGTFSPFEFYDKNYDYLAHHLAYLESLISSLSNLNNFESENTRRIREWMEDI